MTPVQRFLSMIVVGLAALAVIVVFGYTGHLTPAKTYDGFMAYVGLVGISGAWTLASEAKPNADALPHLVLAVAALAALVVLGLHSVFNSDQISAVILLILGPAAYASAAVSTASVAVQAPVTPDPPASTAQASPAPEAVPSLSTITDPATTGVAS